MEDFTSVLDEFKNSDVLKAFLTETFDVKSYTSSIVQLVNVTEHLTKLSAGLAFLDKVLHDQVATKYETLISQATEIETLENVLLVVLAKIQNLISSADRLRHSVINPYIEISSYVMILNHLQITCDLLRRIIKVMQISKRLSTHLQGSDIDIVKAAQLVNELDYLLEGVDLNEINLVKNQLKLLKQAKEQIYSQADVLPVKGIEFELCTK